MGDNKQSILSTLIYSSLFEFPLTEEEIYYYLHTSKSYPRAEIKRSLDELVDKKIIVERRKMYALSQEEEIINKRLSLKTINREKINLAYKLAQLLSVIPTILFIGVSGSVAVGNAKENDDIDLFLITSKNTLFTTRLLSLLLLQLIGKRRKRGEMHAKNKACLNMFMSEESLEFSQEHHDTYTAREIAQVQPLVNRGDTYHNFVDANKWIKQHLSHVGNGKEVYYQKKINKIADIFSLFEPLTRLLQLRIMKNHVTQEEVSPIHLALHPHDVRMDINRQFLHKVLQYNKYYK